MVYGERVYEFIRAIGKTSFPCQFIRIIKQYKRHAYCIVILRQYALGLVIEPIKGYSYGFFFRLHNGWSSLRLEDDPDLKLSSVGWCLMPALAWHIVAHLMIFFSSDWVSVKNLFKSSQWFVFI